MAQSKEEQGIAADIDPVEAFIAQNGVTELPGPGEGERQILGTLKKVENHKARAVRVSDTTLTIITSEGRTQRLSCPPDVAKGLTENVQYPFFVEPQFATKVRMGTPSLRVYKIGSPTP